MVLFTTNFEPVFIQAQLTLAVALIKPFVSDDCASISNNLPVSDALGAPFTPVPPAHDAVLPLQIMALSSVYVKYFVPLKSNEAA